MNLVCCICTETLNASADVFSTPCGHLFHNRCLHQWLERSKSCPQCRFGFAMRSIHKIYFNIGNTTAETSFTDFSVLQQTNDDLKLQLNEKAKEIKNLESKAVVEAQLKSKMNAKYHVAQEKIRSSQFLIETLREQLRLLEFEIERYKGTQNELNMANAKLQKVKLVQDVLDSSAKQAEEIISGETNAKTLAILVATLKRELVSSESKRKELSSLLENVQGECKTKGDVMRMMKKRIESLLNKNEQLQAESDKLKLKPVSPNENDNNEHNKEPCVSPKSRKRISIIKRFHSTDSFELSPPVHEKVRKIEEASSPYLHIKSSSVGLAPLLLKGPVREQGGESKTAGASKFLNIEIFQKPRLFAHSTRIMSATNERNGLNGLGSSERRPINMKINAIPKHVKRPLK